MEKKVKTVLKSLSFETHRRKHFIETPIKFLAKSLEVARIKYYEHTSYLSLVKEAGIIPCKAIRSKPHPIEAIPEKISKECGQNQMSSENAFSAL